MSKEALSLDISRLVSRVVRGETIDVAERGAALAKQYPDLGMSGAMIGQAIERAAGMVGMIRNAPIPPKLPRVPAIAVPPPPPPVAAAAPPKVVAEPGNVRPLHTVRAAPPTAFPVGPQSIDDELAAAIDAEIGNLVSGHAAATAPLARTGSDARTARAAPAHGNGEARTASPAPVRPSAEPPAPAPVAAPRPASVSREPDRSEPAHGSIFSNFRRALFRT